MSRKGENIYKRKDGRWEGRYIKARSSEGKILYGYVYAKTYRDAKARLLQCNVENTIVQNQNNSEVSVSVSFRIIAQQWLFSVEPQIKESSKAKYTAILQKHLLPQFGALSVWEISTQMLEDYRNQLLCCGGKAGTGLAPKTVADIMSVLRAVLSYASRNGERISCDIRGVQIKQKYPQIRILSAVEQNQLSAYLFQHPDGYSIGILLSLYMGLRVGEVCALSWEDISFSEQVIHVGKTMQRIQRPSMRNTKTVVVVTPPKSASSIRKIPIPDSIFAFLQAHQKTDTGYILTNSADRYLEPRTMQYHFKKILKECAIADANYHALRHTFATRCVEVGFDVKTLSEILGHSSVSITMNRYVHPSMELKKQNMQRLSQLFTVI